MAKRHPAQRKASRLLRAIRSGDPRAVCVEIDAGADPNGFGRYDAWPLQVATRLLDESVRDAMTELLLAAGADANRQPAFAERPLYRAARHGYEGVVRMLLVAGGFPGEATSAREHRRSDTLLEYACASGLRWLAELALAKGCRADEVDSYGSTALHHATVINELSRPEKDTAGLLTMLLDHGAPLELQHMEASLYPGTAMHWAVGRGDEAAVRTLVARGADLEARTPKGRITPLFSGVNGESVATLRAALACGADVTAVDAEGRTLLHAAARKVVLRDVVVEVVPLLLAAGADPAARDGKRRTAYESAIDLLEKTRHDSRPLSPQQEQVLAALRQGA